MATQKYYFCPGCNQRTHPQRLFDALRDFSGSAPTCECGAIRELHVVLPFGLAAGTTDCKVLHVFLPRQPVSWNLQNGGNVVFYPFLVILRRTGEQGNSAWLPYWHVVEKGGRDTKKVRSVGTLYG